MGILNEKLVEALFSGEYICSECGALMFFEDEEWRDTLICPKCGHSVDLEHYGFENDEAYEAVYPTKEELLGYDDVDDEDNDDLD